MGKQDLLGLHWKSTRSSLISDCNTHIVYAISYYMYLISLCYINSYYFMLCYMLHFAAVFIHAAYIFTHITLSPLII